MKLGLRTRLRQALPAALRERIAVSRRALRDRLSGAEALIVAPSRPRVDPRGRIEALRLTQPIRRSRHWQGKLHNLRLAARLLDGVALAPGEIFRSGPS